MRTTNDDSKGCGCLTIVLDGGILWVRTKGSDHYLGCIEMRKMKCPSCEGQDSFVKKE